jgi:hypothetical protein
MKCRYGSPDGLRSCEQSSILFCRRFILLLIDDDFLFQRAATSNASKSKPNQTRVLSVSMKLGVSVYRSLGSALLDETRL